MVSLLKSLGGGLLVMIGMAFPWQLLAALNLRTTPAIPWAAPVGAVLLWCAWRYAGGAGPPASTHQARKSLLRARRLTLAQWRASLLAGVPGIGALWMFYGAVAIYGGTPASLAASPALPIQSAVAAVFMSALVAAMSEEAGFRGYMQVPLERRYGAVVAIVWTSMVFTAVHLTHGMGVIRLLPFYAAAGGVYGVVAYATNSVLPSLLLHFAGDVVLFSLVSLHVHFVDLAGKAGERQAYALLAVVGAGVLGVVSMQAFRRLVCEARAVRAGQRAA